MVIMGLVRTGWNCDINASQPPLSSSGLSLHISLYSKVPCKVPTGIHLVNLSFIPRGSVRSHLSQTPLFSEMPKASTSSAAQSEVKIYSKVVALCTAWNKSYNSKGVDQEFTDECKQSQEKMKERLSLKVGLNFEAHNAWPDTPKEMMSEVEAKLAGLTDRDLFIFSYDGHGGSSRTGTFLLKKDLDLSESVPPDPQSQTPGIFQLTISILWR